MVVGEMPEAVDLVVVGAGPGGCSAALEAAERGRRVHLVDRSGLAGVGGRFLLGGGVPSAAFIELAEAHHDDDRRIAMGLAASSSAPDLKRFQVWRQELTSDLGDRMRSRLASADVTVLAGSASFVSPHSLRIEQETEPSRILEFDHAIIATGSRPTIPAGLEGDPRVVDPSGLLNITNLPVHVVVLGASTIGVELVTALAKLGCAAVLVEHGARILPAMDDSIAKDVLAGLLQLGVQVLTGTDAEGMDEAGLFMRQEQGATAILPADLVVAAADRLPDTATLSLAAAGVSVTATGHIVVGESLLASDRIAAIGDAIEGSLSAHRATSEASIAVQALSGAPVRPTALLPQVVRSEPPAASVGLTLGEAIDAGYLAAVAEAPYSDSDRARTLGSAVGRVRIVHEAGTGLLLGATITGHSAIELIAELALATEAGLLVGDLAGTVHPQLSLSTLVATASSLRHRIPTQGEP